MSKFVLKDNPQEEVRIGDSITATRKTNYGQLVITRTITEDVLRELVEAGIVINVDMNKEKVQSELSIMDLITHLAKRINWKVENLKKYIENLYTISPVAVYQILLKECAILIDENYKGHISDVEKVFAISIIDGEIFEMDQSDGKDYTNIAMFRTYTEAKLAKKVLMLIEAELF